MGTHQQNMITCTCNDRSALFQSFLDRTHLLSVNVQIDCKGPVHTFFPQTGNCTTLDHILVESSMFDLVKYCEVLDDSAVNASEHNPIVCSLQIPISLPHCNTSTYVKYNWEKAIRVGSENDYKNNLDYICSQIKVPDDIVSCTDIDNYSQELVSAIAKAANNHLSRSVFKRHLKPYWNQDLSKLNGEMLSLDHCR